MVTLLHDAEVGQPSGTTVSTGNSGGGSDTAFTTVTIAASHTFQYTTASADHGSFGMAVQGNGTGATFGEDASRNDATLAFRAYINFPNTVPSSTPQFWQFRTASANVVRIAMNASNQFLIQVGSAGTNAFTASALTLTTGTWYRVEMEIFSVSATVGSLAFRAYVGDSTSASANSGTLTSLNLGGSNVAVIRRGLLSSAYADIFYLDDDRVDEGVTTPIGPATSPATIVAPVATVTVGAPAPTIQAGTILAAPVATVTVNAPVPLLAAGVNVAPPVATIVAAAAAPTISAGVVIVAPVATVAVSAPAPTLAVGSTVLAPVATVTASAPAPTISSGASVNIAAPVATVLAFAPAPTMSIGVNLAIPTARVTVLAYAPTLSSGLRDITLIASESTPRFSATESAARFTSTESRSRFTSAESAHRFKSSEASTRWSVQEST